MENLTRGSSRFNNRKRPDILAALLERDGPICMGCTKRHLLPDDVKLWRIDHIDTLTAHNCNDNLRIVCNAFNVQPNKNRRLPILPSMCVCGFDRAGLLAPELLDEGPSHWDHSPFSSVLKSRDQLRREHKQAERLRDEQEKASLTPVMRKNKECEGPFNQWLDEALALGMKYDYETWKNAGAQEFSCSPETIRKYLDKRLNPINGDLTITNDGDPKSLYIILKGKLE
jgi:hypothetical protein